MITVDIAEPDTMYNLIEKSCPVERMALNMSGLSDYIFQDKSTDSLVEIEKESMRTVLNSMIDIEDEIRRHWVEGSWMVLIVVGLAEPHPLGTSILERRWINRRQELVEVAVTKTRLAAYWAWTWQLFLNSVMTINVENDEEAAASIVSLYNNSQAQLHGTFRRHKKPQLDWHPNKYVSSLMGLAEAELGEKRATLLIDNYKTFLDACMADRTELENLKGFGVAATNKFFKAIGREE